MFSSPKRTENSSFFCTSYFQRDANNTNTSSYCFTVAKLTRCTDARPQTRGRNFLALAILDAGNEEKNNVILTYLFPDMAACRGGFKDIIPGRCKALL